MWMDPDPDQRHRERHSGSNQQSRRGEPRRFPTRVRSMESSSHPAAGHGARAARRSQGCAGMINDGEFESRSGGCLSAVGTTGGFAGGLPADYSRPTQVATHASLPSASARIHHFGACASETSRPPAAKAAATRTSA